MWCINSSLFYHNGKGLSMAITVEKLKENFAKNGQTLAQWARENGFKPRDVYLVVGGQRKGNYGKGHEIAKKLGLK
ncbi:hypothetical protein B1A90_04360 [Neisseria meningitidis]|nr:hypothetical protein B1A92_07895 [Neisseria meningitidis]OOG98450.1 hypothetical protein B1A91_06590 [Neisseria meningitidis]OOG99840.1 hypothetical protein B1A90_04360 [Neisseria meningitidis]